MEACCTKLGSDRWVGNLVVGVGLMLGFGLGLGQEPPGWAQEYALAMAPTPLPVATPSAEPLATDPLAAYRERGRFQGPVYVTQNFRVQAASPALAQAVGDRAEGYRELLAIQWLGEALPDWPQACPIQVTLSHQAHGETSFLLPENGLGLPSDWDMKVFGPADRLLDSVLPHEITHTVFATYFKQRLPRWADEGACTTVEHASEREKIQALLLRYLSPQNRQGIPFNRMFPMRDYPSDMLPLYAQGYSVAKFLIAQGGPRNFTAMIQRGLHHERSLPATTAWDQAMRESYGYEDLSELQLDWLQWVAAGSQESLAVARLNQRAPVQLAAAALPDRELPANAVVPGAAPDEGRENYYIQQMRLKNPASASPSAGQNRPDQRSLPPSRLTAETAASVGPAGQVGARSDSTILLPLGLR